MSDAAEKTAVERLATPVQFLKGAGPQRAEALARLGLATGLDLLFFFPRDYQQLNAVRQIAELKQDELASVVGVVDEIDSRTSQAGRHMLGVLIRQGTQYLRAIWFNQPHMRKRFARGLTVQLSGRVRLAGQRWEMAHPLVEVLETTPEPAADSSSAELDLSPADFDDVDDFQLSSEPREPAGELLPVYPLTEGISQQQMRRIVHGAVELLADAIDEAFPPEYLAQHRLQGIQAALRQIHQPGSQAELATARRRFVYQELLVLQLALAIRRRRLTTDCAATPLEISAKINARIQRLLPFKLTPGQRGAVDAIAADMGRNFPMNRLLQGEVGSGKTVVAVYAMLLAVAHQHQAVLMAPTEVLARQHAHTLTKLLKESRVRIGLLTGSLTAAERRDTLTAAAAGELDILIGTQAIVQADIKFARLGLVVIDEQHKFGVRQRATLRQAGLDPHYLVMTATPIPRTVAMTQFGDLDVTTLRDAPPGRQPVHTYLATPEQRQRWWEFFRKKLREGQQGFVVTPLVEEAESISATSVQQAFESLANGELEAFRLDLLHGRMPAAEKEAAMQQFRAGKTDVLVATSVVEVGVDIPNATLMTIEGAERFGLAQLHQLRGRVSRGTHPGYVCAFGEPQNEAAQQRLQAFAESTDGFRLAEIDFALRGPGELLGTRQHGLPPLRVADLTRDAAELEEARRDAMALVQQDPELTAPHLARLRRLVLIRYGEAMELGDVG